MSGAFQHNELSPAQLLRDRSRGPFDVAQIRIAALVERRRHADDDAVSLGESPHVGGGLERVFGNELRDRRRIDVLDVTLAGFELVDLALVNIESQTAETRGRKRSNQRETDIAKANDTDARLLLLNQFGEPGVSVRALRWCVRVSRCCHQLEPSTDEYARIG